MDFALVCNPLTVFLEVSEYSAHVYCLLDGQNELNLSVPQ